MNDPFIIGLLVIVVVGGIVLGRVRRDPVVLIALDVAGYALFLISLYWASQIAREAFIAAGGACLGVLLFTTASGLRQRGPAGRPPD